MRVRQTMTLVAKDLRLHAVGMTASGVGILGILWVARLMKPDASRASAIGLMLNLNLLMVIVWGDWLVSREKTKGTIGWLRTLPVPDGTILGAKTAAYMLGCVPLWTASTLLFAPHYFRPGARLSWLAMQCLLIFAGTLSVCGRFRFHQKLGQVLPLIVIGAPVIAGVALRRLAPAVLDRLGTLPTGPLALAAAAALLLVLSAAVLGGTVAWMGTTETFALTE